MRRAFLAGALLLFFGTITARSKNDLLVFVFLRVEPAQDIAILRPMIAPDIGVQLDSGERKLDPGTVLRCQQAARTHAAIVEGQVAHVSELLLNCLPADKAGSNYKFVVKTLEFSPRH